LAVAVAMKVFDHRFQSSLFPEKGTIRIALMSISNGAPVSLQQL